VSCRIRRDCHASPMALPFSTALLSTAHLLYEKCPAWGIFHGPCRIRTYDQWIMSSRRGSQDMFSKAVTTRFLRKNEGYKWLASH
jgi:hypothetical protein